MYPLFLVSVHREDDVIDRAWYTLQALYIIMMFVSLIQSITIRTSPHPVIYFS